MCNRRIDGFLESQNVDSLRHYDHCYQIENTIRKEQMLFYGVSLIYKALANNSISINKYSYN